MSRRSLATPDRLALGAIIDRPVRSFVAARWPVRAAMICIPLMALYGYATLVGSAHREAQLQAVIDGRLPLEGNRSRFSADELRRIEREQAAKKPPAGKVP